jgi:hypothetical protein
MVGISGLFRQQNIEKRRVYSLREWFELGLSDDFRSPGLEDAVRSRAPPPKRARTRRETNSNKVCFCFHIYEEAKRVNPQTPRMIVIPLK